MAYVQSDLEVRWDHNPPRPESGVTVLRRIEDQWWEWRVPPNGIVPQAMAADILGVSLMSVNNWVRQGMMAQVKWPGHPSEIPLEEVKRIKSLLSPGGRLRR